MSETRRLGKYRLIRRLAVGGSAEVYLAVAEGLSGFEKQVVLKRLLPEFARSPEMLAMFLDEARLMALLHHPNIAEVYDIGEQDGEYFFTLEKIDGCDLRDLINLHPAEPLPLAAALTIVLAVAEALAHAHEQRDADGQLLGVVHRDVTPSNVLCGRQGEVKLVDFGVAKWAAQRSRTEQGTIKGKFSYMSPEQCRAEPLDRRSDIFALGVVLYELTTGYRPFAGESEYELLSSIVTGRTEPPSRRRPDYPAGLEVTVLRALCSDRGARFANAGEMRDAVAANARELGLSLGPAAVAELVRAREGARPRNEDPVRIEVLAGRTATDLAAADTEPWNPGRRSPRPGRRWLVGAGALLLSAAAVAAVVKARDAGSAAAPRPAPVNSLSGDRGGAAPPHPPRRRGGLSPGGEAPDPPTSPLGERSPPSAAAGEGAPLLLDPRPTATAARPAAKSRPPKRSHLTRRRSKPKATARAAKATVGETMKVWDPDSATLP
jgi:serine/threonine-protein kinase